MGKVNQDTSLDYRIVDVRTMANQSIFRMQCGVCQVTISLRVASFPFSRRAPHFCEDQNHANSENSVDNFLCL